ncbi:MAG: hypothetical protein MK102_14040 [Fuerstiella sp.]|nr:hypothetical protein [Fuerstiella sp.]
MKFIALDIGSTSIKGVVWDLDRLQVVGKSVRVASPDAIAGLPAGHFELDPMQVTQLVGKVVDALSAADNCDGIVSCTQMAGVVLTDEQGSPLTNYLSWRDQRLQMKHQREGQSCYELLLQRLGDVVIRQLGHECKLGSSLALLFWLQQNGQLPPDAIPMLLGDFVGMQLAHAEPVTEYTNALGAMNLETRRWHDEAFHELGIDSLHWPRLCDPYSPVGHITLKGRKVPWYPSVGDHQCALAGTLLGVNELSINASTGSQVSVLSDDYCPGDYQIRPYFDNRYLNTLTHLPAGRSLNVIVDLLTELTKSQGLALDDPWPYILSEAEKTETDLDVELTFFTGPLGHRGGIRNITLENLAVGPLFRAAFENMAANYETAASRLGIQNIEKLVLSGSLVRRSPTLQRKIIERLVFPQRLVEFEEETMVGLLVLALVASGKHTSLSAASDSPTIRNLAVSSSAYMGLTR